MVVERGVSSRETGKEFCMFTSQGEQATESERDAKTQEKKVLILGRHRESQVDREAGSFG